MKPINHIFNFLNPKDTLVLAVFICCFCIPLESTAQQKIKMTVSPSVNTSIDGHLDLNRKKYFSLAGSSREAVKSLDNEQINYYFKDLKMTLGRALGMVYSENRWGNSFREDANRPGFADIDYMKSKLNPNDTGYDLMKTLLGENQDLAMHDRHTAYPSFMETYTKEDTHDTHFPVNNDAAAEIVANFLKYNYTDFQRPAYFELVNEPHWKFWGDARFHEFHLKAKLKVDKLNVPTKVGGPCMSVSYFYKKGFGNLNQIVDFIDKTNFELDFYSFHTYDYMRWDHDNKKFIGSVTSGLPLESVFDVLASYTYNKYGKELSYVASEHGGYISDSDNRQQALDYLADTYFPGEGFEHEMEKRSIDNFLMVNSAIANTLTFMNHPHVVEKTVPFILLETSGWNTYYYSSLLIKENFDKNSENFAESKLIHFYQFFKDVQGRRVESFSEDPDMQQHAFVDGNKLILVLHNQSDVAGEISIDIDDLLQNPIVRYSVRELKRKEDFRPVLTESVRENLKELTIDPQGSLVVMVNYKNPIQVQQSIDEQIYYSKDVVTAFSGKKEFTVEIPEFNRIKYGELRVGIDRDISFSKEVEITLNGTKLQVPLEDCADRIAGDDDYATTKSIKIPGSLLKEINTIEVNFPDNKEGAVGALLIRAGLTETPIASIDSDGDGVLDAYDNCPNTSSGVLVNEYGCPLVKGNSTFVIQTQSETCPDNNDGKITINTDLDVTCIASLNGVDKEFETSIILDDLTPGTYDLCVFPKGQLNKECYSFFISATEKLSFASKKIQNKTEINILQGTPPFTISLNREVIAETDDFLFHVNGTIGDLIEIHSKKECEGTIASNITGSLVIFPNPTKGPTKINLMGSTGELVELSLIDFSGKLIKNTIRTAIEQAIDIDYSDVSRGMYLLKAKVDGMELNTEKIFLN